MNGGVGLKYFGDDLSPLHKQLSLVIRKSDCFDEARKLFLDLHGKLHSAEVSGGEIGAVDGLTADLTELEYHIMPTSRDETIAWSIWHIARIEDLTMGILAAGGRQVFDEERKTSCFFFPSAKERGLRGRGTSAFEMVLSPAITRHWRWSSPPRYAASEMTRERKGRDKGKRRGWNARELFEKSPLDPQKLST